MLDLVTCLVSSDEIFFFLFLPFSTYTDLCYRLPSFSPIDTCFLGSHRPHHDTLVRTDGWILLDLAVFQKSNRRRTARRCLAVLELAAISASTSMAVHRSFPQAYPMAVLLGYGPDAEIDEHPLRRQRPSHRLA